MRVAVLGGGFQGACVALELALRGVEVDVYEREDRCLTATSARNEGKIHLGLVYANDPSLATARTMIRGAVSFGPLLRRWLGDAVDSIPVSSPYHYVVHRDSMLSVDEVATHLERCHAIAVEETRETGVDYFGSDLSSASFRESDADVAALFDPRGAQAAFMTPEIGIDSTVLADHVRTALADQPRITPRQRSHVQSVTREGSRLAVAFERGGERHVQAYDHVVNALWAGRLAVDETAGLLPDRPWIYRLRYNVRMHAPQVATSIPSVTILLGPFGDVVAYDNDTVNLSWYPVGMRATSPDVTPPAWRLEPGEELSSEVIDGTRTALAGVVPSVSQLTRDSVASYEVNGGIIFAWGKTDIDDPDSVLHERHAIGPSSHGGYHSIDTGKLTMAPLFGKTVADRIIASA